MEETAFCRRCSVVRVNTLCRLYEQGIRKDDSRAAEDLRALVKTARDRGYSQANQLLEKSLDPSVVRRLCWNISSVLTDRDLKIRGIDLGHR